MRTPRWRTSGTEPDYRFSLANERTFLAWIRTALSLVAGGVLLEQFATRLEPRFLVGALAIGLVGLAAALSVASYWRWRDNEIAMRHARPLPTSVVVPLLASSALIVAAITGVLMLRT